MINRLVYGAFVILLTLASCNKNEAGSSSEGEYALSEGSDNSGGNGQGQAGVLTAGEWNDLDNWSFWKTLIEKEDFKSMPGYWSFFYNNRVSVVVTSDGHTPLVDVSVVLKRGGTEIAAAKTDNKGKAELWIDLFQSSNAVDVSALTLDINKGAKVVNEVKLYEQGANLVIAPGVPVSDVANVSLVVDATGSMGDELEYLKTELVDVLSRVKEAHPNTKVLTSSVFYRDEGDEYVTRLSSFTADNAATIDFIKQQGANGGGDFPEAVHTALDKAVNELQWSYSAKARLMFLILDAPPHYNTSVISSLQASIKRAAEKGIKIIPISASGIDKNTEFLMRFFAMGTNGTYTFITDHSGVGNSHLEPSVGSYQVELLNDMMVRIINKYIE